MAKDVSWARRMLGMGLVASAVVAGSVAFTMQTKVKTVEGLYLTELYTRLERAKSREVYLNAIESRLGGAHINNALEMYSVVQDMRSVVKELGALAVEQQQIIESQIKDSAIDGYNAREVLMMESNLR